MDPTAGAATGMAAGGGGFATKAMEKAPDWHAGQKAGRMKLPEAIQWAYVISQLSALTRGRGGMQPSERQKARSEARGSVGSQLQEAQAQLSRGSARQPGRSGQLGQQQVELQKYGMGANLQAESKLREHDLKVARQRRERLQAMWQNLSAQRQRRSEVRADYISNKPTGQVDPAIAGQLGALGRQETAADIERANQSSGYDARYARRQERRTARRNARQNAREEGDE